MLVGEFHHILDKEFRIALPASLREELGDSLQAGLYLMGGPEPCIVIYTVDRLERIIASVEADASLSKTSVREFKRELGRTTVRVVPDAQGRIRLPESLRAHAGIEREVTIVGTTTAIELWSTPVLNDRQAARSIVHAEIAKRVFD